MLLLGQANSDIQHFCLALWNLRSDAGRSAATRMSLFSRLHLRGASLPEYTQISMTSSIAHTKCSPHPVLNHRASRYRAVQPPRPTPTRRAAKMPPSALFATSSPRSVLSLPKADPSPTPLLPRLGPPLPRPRPRLQV